MPACTGPSRGDCVGYAWRVSLDSNRQVDVEEEKRFNRSTAGFEVGFYPNEDIHAKLAQGARRAKSNIVKIQVRKYKARDQVSLNIS